MLSSVFHVLLCNIIFLLFCIYYSTTLYIYNCEILTLGHVNKTNLLALS